MLPLATIQTNTYTVFMLKTLAIANYRSLLNLTIPLGQLNVITGANGSGKSNLYRALRLLAETASGGVINALAKEGGLNSTFWAGPEKLSRSMQSGAVPVQGNVRQKRVRLKLGFASDTLGYSISLGLPEPSRSAFSLDPEIKRESIWAGEFYRPASSLVEREAALVKVRDARQWQVVAQHMSSFDSLFSQIADPKNTPEILDLRETIRNWRFYDHFRTDSEAPARQPQLGTRTPVMHHDGRDLAAAIQTIREIGDHQALDDAVSDARPPPLMVLNEPETSLHPDLLPALARLIIRASENTQVWVVSHAGRLINALNTSPICHAIELEKELGQTKVKGLGMLDEPSWHWPDKK